MNQNQNNYRVYFSDSENGDNDQTSNNQNKSNYNQSNQDNNSVLQQNDNDFNLPSKRKKLMGADELPVKRRRGRRKQNGEPNNINRGGNREENIYQHQNHNEFEHDSEMNELVSVNHNQAKLSNSQYNNQQRIYRDQKDDQDQNQNENTENLIAQMECEICSKQFQRYKCFINHMAQIHQKNPLDYDENYKQQNQTYIQQKIKDGSTQSQKQQQPPQKRQVLIDNSGNTVNMCGACAGSFYKNTISLYQHIIMTHGHVIPSATIYGGKLANEGMILNTLNFHIKNANQDVFICKNCLHSYISNVTYQAHVCNRKARKDMCNQDLEDQQEKNAKQQKLIQEQEQKKSSQLLEESEIVAQRIAASQLEYEQQMQKLLQLNAKVNEQEELFHDIQVSNEDMERQFGDRERHAMEQETKIERLNSVIQAKTKELEHYDAALLQKENLTNQTNSNLAQNDNPHLILCPQCAIIGDKKNLEFQDIGQLFYHLGVDHLTIKNKYIKEFFKKDQQTYKKYHLDV